MLIEGLGGKSIVSCGVGQHRRFSLEGHLPATRVSIPYVYFPCYCSTIIMLTACQPQERSYQNFWPFFWPHFLRRRNSRSQVPYVMTPCTQKMPTKRGRTVYQRRLRIDAIAIL